MRESASAREQNIGISSSIQSAIRWPDRVVTSTPGTTATGLERCAASSRRAKTVLAPGERRDECRAGAERQRDLRRWEQGGPSEEVDPLADACNRAVGQDSEDTAVADHAMKPERRVDRHEHHSLRLPRPV